MKKLLSFAHKAIFGERKKTPSEVEVSDPEKKLKTKKKKGKKDA